MRKTSHDGGDSSSITSGFENETRKTSVGIIKTKRNSIKRKVQNFSHESDDTVIEPLLQIDKTETINRSAKYLLSKSKTDSLNERDDKICTDNKFEKYSVSKPVTSTGTTSSSNTIHNHMNTNIFGGHDSSKFVTTVKSPILVEINGSKATGNINQTSSIFTTAKIHADSITKTMTPVQVTPLPILSTVEGNIVKSGISPDYSQSKNIQPATSSNNSKSINYSSSDTGKSDSSNEPNLKNISTMLDSRSLSTSTKSESKFLNKPCDKQNIIVTSAINTKEPDIENKIVPPSQSSINPITERKSKLSQEQHDSSLNDSIRLGDTETKIGMMDNVISPNQNKSNAKTIAPKELGVTKKEDKVSNSTGGTTKQLQRQKNAVIEDPRDADIHLKNVSEVHSLPTSINKDTTSKGESTIIADVKEKQPSVATSLIKSKDKVTHPTLKSDPVTTNAASIYSKQISTAATKNTPTISKEISSKSDVLPPSSGNLVSKADSTKGKKSLENQINKTVIDNTPSSVTSPKEIVSSKSTIPVQSPQQITSLKSDSSKTLKGSSSESYKSLKDNSSLPSNNKIIPKPTVSVQPTQATAAFKSDFTYKDHDAASSHLFNIGKESSKDDALKLSASAQPLTKLKSDSVKGKKLEPDNSTKDRISSTVVPAKLPITTNPSASKTVNSTKMLEVTPVPKGITTKVHTTLSENTDFKSTIDSQPHKIVKSEGASTPSAKAITTNSIVPISTVTVTTSHTTTKLVPSISSCTNSVAVKSNNELTNRTISTTSSLSSTSTTNSTLAKSSNLTKPSSKPKSTEKPRKI